METRIDMERQKLADAAKSGENIEESAAGYVDGLRKVDDPFNVRDLERSEVLEVLNCSYIARRFFNKSSSWLLQRLNNNIVNGKRCGFSPEERDKFRKALDTLAWEIQEFADNM